MCCTEKISKFLIHFQDPVYTFLYWVDDGDNEEIPQ